MVSALEIFRLHQFLFTAYFIDRPFSGINFFFVSLASNIFDCDQSPVQYECLALYVVIADVFKPVS